MKKYDVITSMVTDALDHDAVVADVQNYLTQKYGDVVTQVKKGPIKNFSEQGFKVWRARVTGVTAKQAGDAHNPKAETTEA